MGTQLAVYDLLFNQFSFPVFTLITLIGVFLLLHFRFKVPVKRIIVVELTIAIIAAAILLILRPGFSDVDETDLALQRINNGTPTFLELFSNYCTSCLVYKPAVDALVPEIEDDFDILRIDIHTEVGRELRRQLTFRYTPEFILFDSNGEEVWRAHVPPSDEELALAIP